MSAFAAKWVFSYFIFAGTPAEPVACPTTECSAYTIVETAAKCDETLDTIKKTYETRGVMILASCVELGSGVTTARRELTPAERKKAEMLKEPLTKGGST